MTPLLLDMKCDEEEKERLMKAGKPFSLDSSQQPLKQSAPARATQVKQKHPQGKTSPFGTPPPGLNRHGFEGMPKPPVA